MEMNWLVVAHKDKETVVSLQESGGCKNYQWFPFKKE